VCGLVIKAVALLLTRRKTNFEGTELASLQDCFKAEQNSVTKGYILETVVQQSIMWYGINDPTSKRRVKDTITPYQVMSSIIRHSMPACITYISAM
jgi:hypothetical protein